MDLDDLSILRDVEHAETEAADLVQQDPVEAGQFVGGQLAEIRRLYAQSKRPEYLLLYHLIWLGYERVSQVIVRRYDDAGPDQTPGTGAEDGPPAPVGPRLGG